MAGGVGVGVEGFAEGVWRGVGRGVRRCVWKGSCSGPSDWTSLG